MKITASRLRSIIAEETRRLIREEQEDEDVASLDVSQGPTAAVDWLNGPGADPRVRALLNSGRQDGKPRDEAAEITSTSKTIGQLTPTQREIELTKSIAFPLAKFDVLKNMISGGVQRIGPKGNDMIITSGDLIVDGHHRWSSLFSVAGPEGKIAAIDIKLHEKDAPEVLAIVQTAIAATLTDGEPIPKAKAGGMNILGESRDSIASMIRRAYENSKGEVGPILTDDFVVRCLLDPRVSKHFGIDKIRASYGVSTMPEDAARSTQSEALLREKGPTGARNRKAIIEAREAIIDKVADNLSLMNQPAEGSPPRVDMPQLDAAKGGVDAALSKLRTGKVNYKMPFKPIEDDSDEEGPVPLAAGRVRPGEVVVERWQKLAGLIKG